MKILPQDNMISNDPEYDRYWDDYDWDEKFASDFYWAESELDIDPYAQNGNGVLREFI